MIHYHNDSQLQYHNINHPPFICCRNVFGPHHQPVGADFSPRTAHLWHLHVSGMNTSVTSAVTQSYPIITHPPTQQAIVASIGSSAPALVGLILGATGYPPGTPSFVTATRTVLSAMIPATYIIACGLFLVVGMRVQRDLHARALFVQTDTVPPLGSRRVAGLSLLMIALVAYIVTLLVLSITLS